MHRIVEAHLNSFVDSFGLQSEEESIQFEKFSNYSVLAAKIPFNAELDDVTTGSNDDGCDGIALIIDEEIVTTSEEVAEIFSSGRRNHEVEIAFIQSKRTDGFDLGDFLKFKEAILRFVSSTAYNPNDRVLLQAKGAFDAVISNAPKIRNGRPSLFVRFVTAGIYLEPEAIEVAKSDFLVQVNGLGLFDAVDIKFIGRDELTSLWVSTYSNISAKIDMFSYASLPQINGIDEAYLAIVRAKDLVENLLTSGDGNLRVQVFEENVRSFLGGDNPVNVSIASTLSSPESATRFPVLNNGITIVSPDVRVQGNTLHLENFQIVNGCQTSNVLFENRSSIGNDLMVGLKVIETSNEEVFSELVKATNNQTTIEENQFLSLKPISKRIENYFNTYEQSESRLYFERRDRQYVGKGIPAIRTFPLHTAAKCVSAMFCNRPDLSFRYPKMMYNELRDEMFDDGVKEAVFFASCLSLYRLHLLISNGTIPQNLKKFKWHLLSIIRRIICQEATPRLNSRDIERQATSIVEVMLQHNDRATAIASKAVEVINAMGPITDDRLKRQAVLNEMFTAFPNS